MMDNWREVKLKEITKLIGGFAFKSKDFATDKSIPIIKIKSLKDRNLIIDGGDFVDEDFLKLDEKYHINYNDIVIALTGSHITLPSSAVGRVAKSRHNRKLLLNQRVGKFIVDSRLCDHDFLYYVLITDFFFESIGLRSKGAANQANISGGDVLDIKINLPPLKTQRKIASILSAYDVLIENNLKRIKLLEEQAQQTYEEWFVRFKFPGYEDVAIDEVSGLPVGWESVMLSDVTKYIGRGISPKYVENNGVPVINQRCIRDKKVNSEFTRQTNPAKKINDDKVLKALDILINSTGTGTLGRVAQIISVNELMTVDTHVTIVRGDESISKIYLGRVLEFNQQLIENLGKGATNQIELSRHDLGRLEVLLPSNLLQTAFANRIKPNYEIIESLINQNQLLKEARDILLPRLMSGMIGVGNIEVNANFDPVSYQKIAGQTEA